MAIQIIRHGLVIDGYDALVAVDGAHTTVHFQKQPKDIKAAVAEWYASRPEPAAEVVLPDTQAILAEWQSLDSKQRDAVQKAAPRLVSLLSADSISSTDGR